MGQSMKPDTLKVNGSWRDVVDAARFTVSKPPLGHEPSANFKRSILIAEHSPIRLMHFIWSWKGIKHWVGVHYVRHVWECFVGTQRTDRTGVPRNKLPQDQPSNFMGEANPQHLIDTSRKRLCYQASAETREQWEDLKIALHEIQPEISDVMVPNCIYRCGCPEARTCGLYADMLTRDYLIGSHDIQSRYNAYNRMFWDQKVDKKTENMV